MKKFFEDFKKFITRGNVIDMAVGVIVGGAFTAIVTSLTNNIIRPFINWILALITGGDGLSSVYTFLKEAKMIDPATGLEVTDLANSIYIDWGALITAIIDFFIIAFVIFSIVRLINKSRDLMKKTAADLDKAYPDRKERKILKSRGVNLRDRQAVKEGLLQLIKEEEEAKAAAEANKPVVEKQEDILKDIRALLQAQVATVENKEEK
jgi:large conductance mechanosensitive channel